MDKYNQFMNDGKKPVKDISGTEENVLFGIIGAFLFSLVGGLLYVLLDRIGFIAAISGLVAVVCAIKGYTFFAKKETKRGTVISVIIAALVIILAWYVSFCIDLTQAYQSWFEAGEVDYVPTFFECMRYGFYFLIDNTSYFINLALGLGLGALGCASYISNKLKREKAAAAVAASENEVGNAEENENEVDYFNAPADESQNSDL